MKKLEIGSALCFVAGVLAQFQYTTAADGRRTAAEGRKTAASLI